MGSTALVAVVVLSVSQVDAQTRTWTGDTSDEWDVDNNWAGGPFPDGDAITATLSTVPVPSTTTLDLAGGDFTLNRLNIAQGFTINSSPAGGTLVMDGLGAQINATG
ncbi:unnamed protein product, partial [Laminaria digitata]